MMEVDAKIVNAIQEKKELSDPKLQTLHLTTLSLVRNRGKLSEQERENFYKAGYENRQLQEIVLGIAQKVMSNYINHMADTPVDEAFAQFA